MAAMKREKSPFAAPLIRAMEERGIGSSELAREAGCTSTYINAIRRGEHWPSHPMALLIAEALEAPSLAAMSRKYVQRTCAVCGGGYIFARGRKRYCSDRCSRTAWDRLGRGRAVGRNAEARERRERVGALARLRLTEHQEAIAAFCDWCKGEPCRDTGCPIWKVSPLRVEGAA